MCSVAAGQLYDV